MQTFRYTKNSWLLLISTLQPTYRRILSKNSFTETILINKYIFQQLMIVPFREEYLLFLHFWFFRCLYFQPRDALLVAHLRTKQHMPRFLWFRLQLRYLLQFLLWYLFLQQPQSTLLQHRRTLLTRLFNLTIQQTSIAPFTRTSHNFLCPSHRWWSIRNHRRYFLDTIDSLLLRYIDLMSPIMMILTTHPNFISHTHL